MMEFSTLQIERLLDLLERWIALQEAQERRLSAFWITPTPAVQQAMPAGGGEKGEEHEAKA
jgi:hypothetical protein